MKIAREEPRAGGSAGEKPASSLAAALICCACLREVEACLQFSGSPRCLSCREENAPLKISHSESLRVGLTWFVPKREAA